MEKNLNWLTLGTVKKVALIFVPGRYHLSKAHYNNKTKVNTCNEVQMKTKNDNESKENTHDVEQTSKQSTFTRILLSFSAYTNTVKLFKVGKNADQLDCLNAIRFLSLCWVILGHSYSFIYLLTGN